MMVLREMCSPQRCWIWRCLSTQHQTQKASKPFPIPEQHVRYLTRQFLGHVHIESDGAMVLNDECLPAEIGRHHHTPMAEFNMLPAAGMNDDGAANAADSTTATHEEPLTPYFHLNQGQGGIFTLPFYNHNGVEVDHIGTHSCWTCVCVYVRLDDKRCFAAHIDGHTRSYYADLEWIPKSERQRSLLKAHIAAELQQALPSPFHNKSEAEKQEMKNSVVIVCPRMTVAHPDNGEEVEGTGAATIEALREHFELPSRTEDLAHGFVVNHATEEVTKLLWDPNSAPTPESLLSLDRALSKSGDNRTAAEQAVIENYPLMLPPEDAGFFEVPGRPWTAVYDGDRRDWRRMRSLDFRPFTPFQTDADGVQAGMRALEQ
ncbi:uncharacterized protein RCC_09214 [Ramularia collo-cygni]|uniref:Uncharacterized protein n=1 Tax=Ramularia collo-cygni TaxID=112498 RepID=A0A2D3V997_9PEZI|nr:uncharacterized protein RCC_09214 [Ramularia collo-cygni]CZT23500.1 uncharacterized protein RCC_09214 [Ramularia collo-cygni]